MTIDVLVVEDDPMVRDIICEYVGRVDGYAVVARAGSADSARRELAAGRVDLIILDIHMPGMNGVRLLAELRAAGDMTDVIFLTASNDTAKISEALNLGAVDYLIKPFAYERFLLALENHRRRYQLLHHASEATQEQLDRMLAQARPATGTSIVRKGLHPKTMECVRACIGEAPEMTVTQQDVAERLGLSKVTARKYLEHLVDTGELEMAMEYGNIGRPTHTYRKK